MDLVALKSELTTDPIGRGYAAMSDEAASVSLNTGNHQPNRESVSGGMLAASIVRSELAALTAADQNYIRSLIPAGDMPLTATLRTEISNVFGPATITRANLLALLKRTGSRADELGLGFVTPSHVADARRLP